MSGTEVCNRCGYENPMGFKFCNNCGRSRNPQLVAKEFPTLVEIHEEANLDRVAMHLWKDARYVPTVQELRTAVDRLNPNRQQVFIKVMSLDLPGVQARRTYAQVAKERNGSSSAVRVAFNDASYEVENALNRARNEKVYRQVSEQAEPFIEGFIDFEDY